MQETSSADLDKHIRVIVSDDKLFAFLQFINVRESIECTLEQLVTIVEEQGVVYGLDWQQLSEIADHPSSFYGKQTMIASGIPPIEGKDGKLEYVYELEHTKKQPLELEDGKVDYREVVSLNNVRQGQLIVTRVPAQKGTPGKTVTGEPLLPAPVKDKILRPGKNVVLNEDKTLLYATIDGMVTKTEKDKMNVFPIYEVNGDIDYSVGNIDFVGSVVIRGNVLNGFKIKASGDIRITGGIEAADLEAGGSIVIGAGIVGQNKAVVKAGSMVRCSFVQEGRIIAGEDVLVTQSIMHSDIKAGRNVICSDFKGLIVGGKIQAREKVSARTIGNSVSTATVIEVGILPELRNELLELRQKLSKTEDNVAKAEQALELLDQLTVQNKLTPDKIRMRIKLQHTRKQDLDEIAITKERIFEIEKAQQDLERARVEVASSIYSGTKLVIGRSIKLMKNSAQRVYFQLAEGEIVMYPMY